MDDRDDGLDASLARAARALKRPPARPLPADFTDRVVAAAQSQALGPGPTSKGGLASLLFRPRAVVLRPVFALAAAVALFAAGAVTVVRGPGQAGTEAPNVLVRFAVRAPSAQSVSLAGDFNGWGTEDIRLADPEGDGVWYAIVPLNPGVYQYMFVLDGETWIPDPMGGEQIDDGFGQKNSLVRVAEGKGKREGSRAL